MDEVAKLAARLAPCRVCDDRLGDRLGFPPHQSVLRRAHELRKMSIA
jgi:hypothetical protein